MNALRSKNDMPTPLCIMRAQNEAARLADGHCYPDRFGVYCDSRHLADSCLRHETEERARLRLRCAQRRRAEWVTKRARYLR